MGRYPSSTFLNGSIRTTLIAHELGHAFSLDHACLLECGAAVIGGPDILEDVSNGICDLTQDDAFDLMGSAQDLLHYSAPLKERLGWFEPAEIEEVSTDGEYVIGPYAEALGSHPKVLKVFKGLDPKTGVPWWYYLEYRQAIGHDAPLAGNENVVGGILVRMAVAKEDMWTDIGTIRSSILLDMTPESKDFTYDDRRDPALTPGMVYSDPNTGLTIETLWTDGASAGIRVGLGSESPPTGGGSDDGSTGGNSAPSAVDDVTSTDEKTAVSVAVLSNDSDPDGDSLTVESVGNPKWGSVRVNADGTVTYTPGRRAKGSSDVFSYVVSDGKQTASARVTVDFIKSTGGGKKRR
jgi:hypothetical protein